MHTERLVKLCENKDSKAATFRSFALNELAKFSTHMNPLEARRFEFTREPAEGKGGHNIGGSGTVPLAKGC